MNDFADLPLFVKPTREQHKLAAAWDDVKRKHPQLLPELARIAREYRATGHNNWSISGLFEVLRWETRHSTDDLGLKVNNNHKPFASRAPGAWKDDTRINSSSLQVTGVGRQLVVIAIASKLLGLAAAGEKGTHFAMTRHVGS